MKKVLAHLLSFSLLALLFFIPYIAEAQSFDLIVCGRKNDPDPYQCTLADLIQVVRNLVNALVMLSTLLATLAFVWMGLLLITSGGNESRKKRAKDIGLKVLIGYLWILAAWILVATVFGVILNDEYNLLK